MHPRPPPTSHSTHARTQARTHANLGERPRPGERASVSHSSPHLQFPGSTLPPALPPPPPPSVRTLHVGVVELRLKGEDRSAVTLNAPWPEDGKGGAKGGGGGGGGRPKPKPAPGGAATWLLDDVTPAAGTALDLAPPAPGDRARAHAAVSLAAGGATYSLAAVFDGHNGPAAAAHCATELAEAVRARLPRGAPPPGEADSEDEGGEAAGGDAASLAARALAGEAWRGGLAAALVGAFHDLQHGWAARGRLGGSTATVALQTGRLLMVANVGDSLALLDSGASVMPLTGDHR